MNGLISTTLYNESPSDQHKFWCCHFFTQLCFALLIICLNQVHVHFTKTGKAFRGTICPYTNKTCTWYNPGPKSYVGKQEMTQLSGVCEGCTKVNVVKVIWRCF